MSFQFKLNSISILENSTFKFNYKFVKSRFLLDKFNLYLKQTLSYVSFQIRPNCTRIYRKWSNSTIRLTTSCQLWNRKLNAWTENSWSIRILRSFALMPASRKRFRITVAVSPHDLMTLESLLKPGFKL